MGLGAVLLGVFAFVCMFGGMLLSWVPFVGTMLSFLSPVLAIGGMVLGGVAMSRAKEAGEQDGLAIAGLVVNVVAFVPAMAVALICGGCNMLCTGAMLAPRDPNAQPFWQNDSGPSPWDLLFRDAGTAPSIHPNVPPPLPPDPSTAPATGPSPAPATPAAPATEPAPPPPPLPPGPTTAAPTPEPRTAGTGGR